MNILGIETSCDETSAAVIKDGVTILSNVIASQNEFHTKYGGIVPEIAARKHIEVVAPVIKESIDRSGISFKDIDAVAVTFGPGLPGSLIVGLSAAKAIAFGLNIPLIGVNHLEGHIYANYLAKIPNPNDQIPTFPFIALIVSGGHTQIVLVKDHCEYETLGRTRDDAAGEAFDKVARFLDLGYPGGPIIDKMSKGANDKAVDFKRPMLNMEGYDFSFSGIKTAVVYYVKKYPDYEKTISKADLVASFQKAVVETLVERTIQAAKDKGVNSIALAGGVSANSLLRSTLKEACDKNNFTCIIPPFEFCTDNAAMIGSAGYFRIQKGFRSDYSLAMESTARL